MRRQLSSVVVSIQRKSERRCSIVLYDVLGSWLAGVRAGVGNNSEIRGGAARGY